MNERIRQLAEQAGLRFTQLMSNPMVPVVDGKETDLAKFAELIVRECGNVAYKAYWDSPEKVRGIHFKEKIAQHFGVE